MSKNRVIVTIALLLVVLALVTVAKNRDGGSEVGEVNEEKEAN